MNFTKANRRRQIQTTNPVFFNNPPSLLPLLFLLLFPLLFVSGCAQKQQTAVDPHAVVPAPAVPQVEKAVVAAAKKTIGVRYKYGGTSPETGFDCSGLVCWAYEQVGIQLPRRAKDQLNAGMRIKSKSDLKPGDIVVFKGTRSRSGWHSGIYSGNGMFVHSPTSGKAVTESSLHDNYFAKRFAGASRVSQDGRSALMHASLMTGYQDDVVRVSAQEQAFAQKEEIADASEKNTSPTAKFAQGAKKAVKSRSKNAKSTRNSRKAVQTARKKTAPKAAKPLPQASAPSRTDKAGPQAAVNSPKQLDAHL